MAVENLLNQKMEWSQTDLDHGNNMFSVLLGRYRYLRNKNSRYSVLKINFKILEEIIVEENRVTLL